MEKERERKAEGEGEREATCVEVIHVFSKEIETANAGGEEEGRKNGSLDDLDGREVKGKKGRKGKMKSIRRSPPSSHHQDHKVVYIASEPSALLSDTNRCVSSEEKDVIPIKQSPSTKKIGLLSNRSRNNSFNSPVKAMRSATQVPPSNLSTSSGPMANLPEGTQSADTSMSVSEGAMGQTEEEKVKEIVRSSLKGDTGAVGFLRYASTAQFSAVDPLPQNFVKVPVSSSRTAKSHPSAFSRFIANEESSANFSFERESECDDIDRFGVIEMEQADRAERESLLSWLMKVMAAEDSQGKVCVYFGRYFLV